MFDLVCFTRIKLFAVFVHFFDLVRACSQVFDKKVRTLTVCAQSAGFAAFVKTSLEVEIYDQEIGSNFCRLFTVDDTLELVLALVSSLAFLVDRILCETFPHTHE